MATVASTTRFTTHTLASDSAGPFNVGFRLFETDAVTVYVGGVLREDWTLTSTLAEAAFDDAATITFDAALASGSVIWIEGTQVPERPDDYANTEPRLTDLLNIGLARITAPLVEAQDRTLKSFRLTQNIPPVDFSNDDGAIPIFLDGRFQVGPTAPDIENAQANAALAQAAADIVEAATTEVTAEQYVSVSDGSADVSSDFSDFMAALVDGPMGVAVGTYRLDSQANVNMDGTAPGEHLSMRGAGVNSSTILVNNSDGGLKFTGTSVARQHTVSLSGLQVYPGLADSGIGIQIVGTAGGVTYQPCCVLRDIALGGIDDGGDETFTTPLSITGVNRPVLDNLWIYQHLTATTKWDKALNLDGCYGSFLRHLWINCKGSVASGGGALVGISSVGTTEEGLVASNVTVNGADIGLDYERTGREPGFQWSMGHINHRQIGMRLNGVKDCQIDNATVYSQDPISGEDTIDFLIEDANDLTILYPHFRGDGDGGSKRHFWLEPKSGKAGAVVKNIHIYLAAGCMSGETDVAPIYINGATNVTLHLPKSIEAFDFADYPDWLVEIGGSQDPDEIHIVYDEGGVAQTKADATAGPFFEIDRHSASPADDDQIGAVSFYGRNDADEKTEYARISTQIDTVADGAEYGTLDLQTKYNGTMTRMLSLFRPAATGDTGMFLVTRDGTSLVLRKVTMGATDSGGTGFRVLRVPNA